MFDLAERVVRRGINSSLAPSRLVSWFASRFKVTSVLHPASASIDVRQLLDRLSVSCSDTRFRGLGAAGPKNGSEQPI